MTQKEQEYMGYIEEHIHNVEHAYSLMKDDLLNTFDVRKDELDRRILNHDSSKYTTTEFSGYRQWFYPEANEHKDENAFNTAWKAHYTTNDHHPEHWKIKDYVVEMQPGAIAEMFCDWMGMSIKFKTDPVEWYHNKMASKEPFEFHPKTKEAVENNLWILKNAYLKVNHK